MRSESRSHHFRSHHSSTSDLISNSGNSSNNKKPRLDSTNGSLLSSVGVSSSVSESSIMDIGNSDHVDAVTQLREQLANLHKQRNKDKQELLEKDKKVKLRSALEKYPSFCCDFDCLVFLLFC